MQLADVKSTPLFAPATRRQQRQIAGLADDVEVPAGTVLTVQGRYAREFFVIADGYAEVRGDGELVATLGPGEFFGELGLLEGHARTATVVAATPMRLLVLAGREFRRLLDVVPAVAAEVEATAGARRRLEQRTARKESTVRYEEQLEAKGAATGAAR